MAEREDRLGEKATALADRWKQLVREEGGGRKGGREDRRREEGVGDWECPLAADE